MYEINQKPDHTVTHTQKKVMHIKGSLIFWVKILEEVVTVCK